MIDPHIPADRNAGDVAAPGMREALRGLADDEGRPLPATARERLSEFRARKHRRRFAQTSAAVVAVFALGMGGAAIGDAALTDTVQLEPAVTPSPDQAPTASPDQAPTTVAEPSASPTATRGPVRKEAPPSTAPTTGTADTADEANPDSKPSPTSRVKGSMRTWAGMQVLEPEGWTASLGESLSDGSDGPPHRSAFIARENAGHDLDMIRIGRAPAPTRLDPMRETGGLFFYQTPCGEKVRPTAVRPVELSGNRGTYAEFRCTLRGKPYLSAKQWVFPDQGVMIHSDGGMPADVEKAVLRSMTF